MSESPQDRMAFPPGMFSREPPPESASWQWKDWQRWAGIDLIYQTESAMAQHGRDQLATQGFSAILPLETTWEDAERMYDRLAEESEG